MEPQKMSEALIKRFLDIDKRYNDERLALMQTTVDVLGLNGSWSFDTSKGLIVPIVKDKT